MWTTASSDWTPPPVGGAHTGTAAQLSLRLSGTEKSVKCITLLPKLMFVSNKQLQ